MQIIINYTLEVASSIYGNYRVITILDSFEAHFQQNFNTNTSRIDIRKYMTSKVLSQLNLIGKMKTFTKPNCNICME